MYPRTLRRRFVALTLVLLAALTTTTHAQLDGEVVTLSPRIGPTIDSLEREYFGLFPRFGSMVSAHATRTADGGLLFEVDRLDREDTSFTLSRERADQLIDYIDRYEALEASEEEHRFDPKAPFRMSGRTIDRPEVRLELLDGSIVEGMLLHVDERGMIVLPLDGPYEWRKLATDAIVVRAEAIDRVVTTSAISVGIATGVAAAGAVMAFAYVNQDLRPQVVPFSIAGIVGGMLGGSWTSLFATDHQLAGGREDYRAQLPMLAGLGIFYDLKPPELRHYADSALTAASRSITPSDLDHSFGARATRRFSIAVLASAPGSNATTSYLARLPNSLVDSGRASRSGAGVAIEASYDLSPTLTVSGTVDYRKGVGGDENEREREKVDELGAMGVVELNLSGRRALGRRQMEVLLGLGAGASYMDLTASVRTPARDGIQVSRMTTTVPSAMARMQVRANFSSSIALQVGMLWRWYGTISVPEYGYIYPTTFESGTKVEAHDIDLSGLQVQIGARYWF